MKWRSIKTAPKDGTPILFVARPAVREPRQVYAGWYSEAFAPFPWVFVDDPKESLAGCCDHEMTGRVYTNGFPAHIPTHWMPLPEAPK
jgi:hypothetical protein